MPIQFTPRRRAILICDFERAFVMPEMRKKRRVVVVSPTGWNTYESWDPGTCTVVPLSATPPRGPDPRAIPIPVGRYRSVTMPVWAKCGLVQTVSNARLERVFGQGGQLKERVTQVDMTLIEDALAEALDI